MINELFDEKMIIRNNYLIVTTEQKAKIEEILKESGYNAKWFVNNANVKTYSPLDSDCFDIGDWSVFFESADVAKIQSMLDAIN